jgi:hypothetical protein
MNDGHAVVGIDGLKIEPLPPELSGVATDGTRVPSGRFATSPNLREPLDTRAMAGFGGVAEYGITVRWDKNFLKIARLLVERRSAFAMFGGVRFGGTLTAESAFDAGLRPQCARRRRGQAHGARPAARPCARRAHGLRLPHGPAAHGRGQGRLDREPADPAADRRHRRRPHRIDTATESLAYYPLQVEKFLARYEALAAETKRRTRAQRMERRRDGVAEEYLTHALAMRAERDAAAREGREPRIVELLQSWGGATIAYRKRLIDSPSYTLNHEEVEKALEEGIRFARISRRFASTWTTSDTPRRW